MPSAVPHHFVITVQLDGGDKPTAMWSQSGVVEWMPGETRQDQYAKVLQHVSRAIREKSGRTIPFVPVFWDLTPNHP